MIHGRYIGGPLDGQTSRIASDPPPPTVEITVPRDDHAGATLGFDTVVYRLDALNRGTLPPTATYRHP